MWPKRKPIASAAPARPEKVRLPFPQGHTLVSWRKHPALAQQLKAALGEQLFQHVLSVLHNEIPSGYPRRGDTLNDTMANIELGRMQGYMDCLNLLQNLAEQPTNNEPPEQDYGATGGDDGLV